MYPTRTILCLFISLVARVLSTPLKARPMGQIKVVGPGYSLWTSSLEACVKYCDSSDQCDAINYHSSTHKCRLFAPCTHVYSMYGSLDYYFYSKRPQILDHGFVFDKDRDTCIKLMEIGSDMSQGDRVCTRQNGRLLDLAGPSTQDIAVKLMIHARQRPKYVWTGGGPWDWKSEFTRSTYFPSNQDPGSLDNNPPLCSVLEITGQWLKVPCDQGNYMSLCEVPAFYTLVKYLPTQNPLYTDQSDHTTISYPTVSFPSYDALTPPPGTYPSPYDGADSPQYHPNGNYFPNSGNYPSWGNVDPPNAPIPPGYIPSYGTPVNPSYGHSVPTYHSETYPSHGNPIPPVTLRPPIYSNYPPYASASPPPSNYPIYPTPPVTSPPTTYSIPAPLPPTNLPPQHYPNYSPTIPSSTNPPTTYPAYSPPFAPPTATYTPPAPPLTPPTATYSPPVAPSLTNPPTANYPTYSPPAPPPSTYGPPAPPNYPVYPTPPAPAPSIPTYPSPPHPPQYLPTTFMRPSLQPSYIPSPHNGGFPLGQFPPRHHFHFLVPQNPPSGYPLPTQGPFRPSFTYNTPSPNIYYYQPATYLPNPNSYQPQYPTSIPNCVPLINQRHFSGYDCKPTSPPLTISTFPPAINPYFPPLLIYQPGYQVPPTPHYKGYVPPAAHPTNIPYQPITDFLEKPPFQGRTYIVKGDMAYEIPTQQRYQGWDRDYILNGRSVNPTKNESKVDIANIKTEQMKPSNEPVVPSQKTNTNEASFYYSKSNHQSNTNSLPRDDKNISGTNMNNPGHSISSNTTVINKNSTFSTNVEYTKNFKSPNLATIEIQGGGRLTKIIPSDGKRFSNNTAVITPLV